MPIVAAELERKCRELYVGETFTLNNGAKVTIPSIPIGKKAVDFIRMQQKLQEPQKNEDGSDNPKYLDPMSEKGMEFFGKMLWKILSLNYDITEDEADGLFSMQQFNEIVSWFFTGQKDIGASLVSSGSDPTAPTPSTASVPASAKPGEELLS